MPYFVRVASRVIALADVIYVEFDPARPIGKGPEIHLRLRNGETFPVPTDSDVGRELARWHRKTVELAALAALDDDGPEPLAQARLASLGSGPRSYARPPLGADAAHYEVPVEEVPA